jgi:predicted hotdog family 3-hydroxylacyl-ACP dehydratase
MKPENIHNTLPCDAGPLVPHQPPMLLVSRLIEKADDSVEGSESIIEAVVPHTGPFLKDGNLLPEYYIEVLAQAVAASDGFPPIEGKKPATGLLAGIDEFSWTSGTKPGDLIRITIHKTFEFGAAFILSGFISNESGQVAKGQLKIWKIEG